MFQFLLNKLNFCCRNYSREGTIQKQKLFEGIRYPISFEFPPLNTFVTKMSNFTRLKDKQKM